ncbi:MotA/TolQ/ExbB proton channel family protein [Actinomadura rupiterrae]|uniref:MotA/TolQ/ExbB proton channel family protein n=1 Tax=Actinomadura rupiterrae TaxID=559627 RepID=UPI0020A58203|nr:MotA/TolQ/ExbB proton channel family protein [Actinomadura rupiterrae]MCP2334700.1 hypothetical protein [Actinomadura rupiterrae]
MTNTPSYRTMSADRAIPGREDSDSAPGFLIAGGCAIAITLVGFLTHLLGWIPFAGRLLREDGPVGIIAALIVAATLWVVFFALGRLSYVAIERSSIVAAEQGPSIGASGTQRSLVDRRLTRIRQAAENAHDEGLLATYSELDHGKSDIAYGAARALVWAMPALGFLGTAAEMSASVRGLGGSIRSAQDYSALKNALVVQVLPHLAQAFAATLLALGASVVCHLLLTWTNVREQRLLLMVEDRVVKRTAGISRAARPSAGAPPAFPIPNQEIQGLAEGLARADQAAQELAERLDDVRWEELNAQLVALNGTLLQIHESIGAPLVLQRQNGGRGA